MANIKNEFHHYFEQEFLEIGSITINLGQRTIVIATTDLIILREHPNFGELSQSQSHLLTFKNVVYSKREFREYKDKTTDSDFMPTRVFVDGPFIPISLETNFYTLSAVLQQPRGWIEWDIEASDFSISLVSGDE